MVSRRTILAGVVALGIGGGAYATNDDVRQGVNAAIESSTQSVGDPKTETLIKEVSVSSGDSSDAPIESVEIYESGAAIVYPKADRGECHDYFAIMHENTDLGTTSNDQGGRNVDTSDALGSWQFGDFDEPVTIDLRSAISGKGNYPSTTFKIRAYPDSGICIRDFTSTFKLPKSFLPA